MSSYFLGSFHINRDLAELVRMSRIMSRKLSEKARIRLGWMDAYRECENAAQVCRHFSIPLRTFWRWRKRYDPFDLGSLESRKRGPKGRSSSRTAWTIERRVLALRREHPQWGRAKLALLLKREEVSLSERTVGRILSRNGRSVRYRTRKRRAPKPRVNLAEISVPGDLVQIDTKYVSLGSRRMFQYTAVDAVSRWRHAEIHPSLDGETTVVFLASLAHASPFAMKVIQTDNGKEFGRKMASWCRTRGIRHVFTHKARPIENGCVERSHRTDEQEFWSEGGHGTTVAELRQNFANYMAMYNNERPHWALGGKTPIEALADYSLN
jgi:transposase InsO family protein